MAEHTDKERLDWMILQQSAEFDSDADGYYVAFWLAPCSSPSGIPGYHLARGNSVQACIDAALDGNVKLID